MTPSKPTRRIGPVPALVAVIFLLGGMIALSFGPKPRRAQAQSPAPPVPSLRATREEPYPTPPELREIDLANQTREMAQAKSTSCTACHAGSHDPHYKDTVRLGCTDCHGGDAQAASKELAHISPKFPEVWATTANPVRTYTLLNHETPEFVRFVNPGDFRIAHLSCGTTNCHPNEVAQNKKSMMTHGAMLWGAALYNNGSYPLKASHFGESYSMNGTPQRIQTIPPQATGKRPKRACWWSLIPCPVSRPASLVMSFASSSVESRRSPRLACRTRLLILANPRLGLVVAVLGPGIAPIPCLSA